VVFNGRTYLTVAQFGEFEGGQHVFELAGDVYRPVYSDSVADLRHLDVPFALAVPNTVCGSSTGEDHAAVAAAAVAAVDHFSSAAGPDHGNLACVWAVRHIVFRTLNRWITTTDGTAVFGPELRACFNAVLDEAVVPAGGIVISPTRGSHIGHVGILGPATGDDGRLIYSNSSAAALWKQNFNVARWPQRYVETKGLQMLFFPLPFRQPVPVA
jgi:hypothetical protein